MRGMLKFNDIIILVVILKKKHIIFDLDGTLVDSETSIMKTWIDILAYYAPQRVFTKEELQVVLGISSKAALAQLQVEVDEHFEENWIKMYRKYGELIAFYPEVEVMLEKLHQNFVLGIVSSRSREEYEMFFTHLHLEKYFTSMILKDDTKKHKPDTAPLLEYMKVNQCGHHDCIYIGDMPTDVKCAQGCEMKAGILNWKKEMNSDADICFSSCEEILAYAAKM